MNSALERLLSLRVADAMTKDIVTLAPQQTMAEAAAVFVDHGITGAPVVDDSGRCIGVLSATDFVRERLHCPTDRRIEAARQAPAGSLFEAVPYDLAEDADRVGERMTPAVHAVPRDASLIDAARILCDSHVHRVPVLDDEGRLQGILSSLDIVAALVNAIEE